MLYLLQGISHTVPMADFFFCDAIKSMNAFSFAEIVRNSSREANTMRSAAFTLGTNSEKPSFCIHGFPYWQALELVFIGVLRV